MFIKTVCISGFKNHKELKIFNFYNYSEILGRNAQGKTTLGEAITWGFFGCDLKGDTKCDTKLMNKDSDSMFVIIDYEYEGMTNRIVRKKTMKSLTLKLNDERITEKELSKHLPNRDLFLAIFNPKVFLTYTMTKQRELLLKMLPEIDYNDIINKHNRYDLKELLEKYPNINEGLKKLKNLISNKDNLLTSKNGEISVLQKLILENTNNIQIKKEFTHSDEKRLGELENTLVNRNLNSIELISTDNIKAKISEINGLINVEANTVFKSSNTENIQELNISLATLSGEHKSILQTYIKFTGLASVCSMCGQPITEEHRQKELQLLIDKMDHIQSKIDALYESICLLNDLDEMAKKSFDDNKARILLELENNKKALTNELTNIEESNKLMKIISLNVDTNDIEIELKNLKQKQLDFLSYQANINTQKLNEKNYKNKIESINNEILNIIEQKNSFDIEYHNLKDYSSLYVQYVGDILSGWLNRVSLNLFTVTDQGEIKDTFEIKYDNKPLRLISNSEFIRVGLEISNMFNNTLGINLPVFVDDAESIIDIPRLSTQMIVAKVQNCELVITSSDKDEIASNSEVGIKNNSNNDTYDFSNHKNEDVLSKNIEVQQLCLA